MWPSPPPIPHTTALRPLPSLPPHLQSQYSSGSLPSGSSSRPGSPDPNVSSSNASTPNASEAPRYPMVGYPKRGRQKQNERNADSEASGPDEAAPSKGVGKDGDVKKEKSAKRVRVGARASIACAVCRRRKVRCSGEWPVCAFCSTRGLPCEYEGHPAENGGPMPNTYPSAAAASFGIANFLPMTTIEPILPPLPIILEALDIFFLHNYDTFYFLHRSSLTQSIRDETCAKELVCCILAFAGRFSQSLKDLHPTSPSAASEHYAALGAQVLQNPPPSRSTTPGSSQSERDISLTRCQCSLILGLWEVTEGSENKGWLRIGTAIRLAQVLRLGFVDEDEAQAASPLQRPRADPIAAEIRRRTFWACFLLDRTITDGKERPSSLSAPTSLRMPGSDADFNLGRQSLGAKLDPDQAPWNIPSKVDLSVTEPEADLYGQTLRISEIWNHIIRYIGSGGRNFDRRPPWLPESTFAILDREINIWDARLPAHFRFSEPNMVAHTMIGQTRLFGMLHLLAACCKLVLHRDHIPFLPPGDYQPKNGPVDGEPLYGLTGFPPPRWWESSFEQAVDAAGIISTLATQLVQHGSQITHPFGGFASIAAATMHAHLKYWPQSSRQGGQGAFRYEQDVSVLNGLRDVYPIAANWCEAISKLNRLYSNLVRGVLDADPSKVRANVIKLLRTREEDSGAVSSASSTGNGNGDTVQAPILPPPSSLEPYNGQFPDLNAPSVSTELGLDDDYSLDLSALGNVDWTSWDLGWMNVASLTDNSLWGL